MRAYATSCRERGAALVIVLALAGLLLGVVLAYFSRTTGDRQVAHESFNQSKADQLASTAINIIVNDLLQEITSATGSTATTVNNATLYVPNPPTTGAYVVPQRNHSLANAPNLVRLSSYPDPMTAPGVSSLASAVLSTVTSANNRSITPARWNSHYLLGSSLPAGFTPPYWVILTRNGRAQFTGWNSQLADASPSNYSYAVGRYAYAIYDEGGLLDANVAGCPTNTTTDQSGPKGLSAFADLSAVGLSSTGVNNGINALVGWRNYASVQQTQGFPPGSTFPNFLLNNASYASDYFNFVLQNTSSTSPTNGFQNTNWQIVYQPPGKGPRTDQGFPSRQSLIQLCLAVGSSNFPVSSLQYFGTFSREQNVPTWLPSPVPPTSLLTRFPLGKFNLVSTAPPGPSVSSADIKTYFGLQWYTGSGRWQYVEQGSTPLSAISPITAGVQPNLFQVLNYLLPGHTIDQILSLGACMIDQFDLDSNTTQIEYGTGSPLPIAYGMEAPGSPRPPGAPPPPANYVVLNRGAFRNVGELGYAYNPITGNTVNFTTTSSNPDARLLDFLTYTYDAASLPAPLRAGVVNLSTRNPTVLAAIISGATYRNNPSSQVTPGNAATAADRIVNNATDGTIAKPALSRADVARLASSTVVTNPPFNTNEEARETIARALAEVGQTRTWNLMVDVITQSGRYPPNANSLAGFVVEGEQHYWVHVAIDRFTGQVIDKQIEVVNE